MQFWLNCRRSVKLGNIKDKTMNEEDKINFDEEVYYLPQPKPSTMQIILNRILPNKLNPLKERRIKMGELNNYGVENLKKVGTAIASLINAGIESKSNNGKIGFSDIGKFLSVMPEILAAIPAVQHVKSELTDKITQEELEDFKSAVLPYINIRNYLDAQFVSILFDALHVVSKLITNRIERKKESDAEPKQA